MLHISFRHWFFVSLQLNATCLDMTVSSFSSPFCISLRNSNLVWVSMRATSHLYCTSPSSLCQNQSVLFSGIIFFFKDLSQDQIQLIHNQTPYILLLTPLSSTFLLCHQKQRCFSAFQKPLINLLSNLAFSIIPLNFHLTHCLLWKDKGAYSWHSLVHKGKMHSSSVDNQLKLTLNVKLRYFAQKNTYTEE